MPSGVPKPATAAQLAMYGHVATRLRAYLAERNIKPPKLADELGLKGNAQLYKWLGGKAGMGPGFRRKLAKLMGCSPDDLRPREPGSKEPMLPATLAPVRKIASKVLEFDVTTDGDAHIKLDLTMPIATAMPFMRLLMDVGVLVGKLNLDEVR
jgi:transcriptional regulator with XRE-family HTH domain